MRGISQEEVRAMKSRKCEACLRDLTWRDFDGASSVCQPCAENMAAAKEIEAADLSARAARLILTTETAHNLPVTERLGIIAAECVFGMHLFKDMFALGRDIFGGRSATMQNTLKDARNVAMGELRLEAVKLGADAVVGIDLDYSEISGGGKSMLFLVVSGTAVKISKP